MSENLEPNDASMSSQEVNQQERVGDILHKERVTRRITLDTIAKDLKINVKYIKAIESSSFNELPPEPYVRVYMRSIASYLMLNPDELLKQFYKERGIVEHNEPVVEEKQNERVTIDVRKDSEKKSFSVIILVFVIVVVSILVYISSKIGLIPSEHQFQLIQKNQKTNEVHHDDQNVSKSVIEASKSQQQTQNIQTVSVKKDDTSEVVETNGQVNYQPSYNDSLKLAIRAVKDSLYLHVFADGSSWKNHLRAGNTKVFFARDSIAVYVDEVSGFVFMLNDEDLQITGAGQKIFKIDHTGLEYLKPQQWKSTYKTRL